MARYLCVLVYLAACLLRGASGQNSTACSVDIPLAKLESLLTKFEAHTKVVENMRTAQEDLRQEQQDLKNHILNLTDLTSQIEEQQNATLVWIKNLLDIPKDCQDVYTRGFRTSGMYTISPDGATKISVYCEQDLDGGGWTVTKDCQDAYTLGFRTSGVYKISPDGVTKINVYCEQKLDGGGWTVFQRRQDGSEDFYRDWVDYKMGFGNLPGEFWLGNDNIHLLTKDHDQKLKIELKYNGQVKYADYSTFWIDNEDQKYNLTVSGFSGSHPPGDSFTYHNQYAFSTKDRDNDAYPGHCAQISTGAWWYGSCHHSNLNGVYGSTESDKGVNWKHWKSSRVSMTGTRMMFKRKN